MSVKIHTISEFDRKAKALAKKYNSFRNDLDDFIKSLKKQPQQGTSLGHGAYKVRMAIASKGKGKSGGARVITYHIEEGKGNENFDLTLLTIYDKSEIDNISDAYLRQIISMVKDS